MKFRVAGILLLAGLGVPAAQAAEREVGGKISLGYGFKPEFVEAEGDGKYVAVGGKVSMVTDKTWTVSFEESLKAVEHPEKEATLADPIVRLALPTEALGMTVAYGLALSPGLSLASRDAHYYGYAKSGVSATKKLGDAEVGAGVSTTRHFQRYTLGADGSSTTRYGVTGSVFGSYEHGDFSVSLTLAYREAVPHAGDPKYGYLNELSFEYQATKPLSFEVTFSTSDAQKATNGSDINEFSVYRQNKTEVYLGATYAL